MSRKHSHRRGASPRAASRSVSAEEVRSEGHRQERLGQVLREEIDSLLRDDVRDPALEGVRVCAIDLSVDGRYAKVHVTTPSQVPPAVIERSLERVIPFLRGHLADALDMKFVPALRFTVVQGVWRDDAVKEEP